MKQQRRHELQTNQLADRLGVYLQEIQPYTSQIAIGIAAIAILGVVLLWWGNSTSASQGASWSDYFEAAATRDAGALDEVAKLHTGTPAALWAHLSAGDVQYAKGAGLVFRDRDEAEETLKEAEEHYLVVKNSANRYPWLMERAEFGLGQVNESLAEVKGALEHYKLAAAINPESAIGKAAQQRVDRLSDETANDWYEWFAEQEPPAPGDESAMGGLGPNLSEDLDSLSDRPDFSFPESNLPMSTDGETPGDLPAGDTPASTDDLDTSDESSEVAPPAPTESAPPASDETPAPADAGSEELELTPPETPAAEATESPAATDPPAPAEENN